MVKQVDSPTGTGWKGKLAAQVKRPTNIAIVGAIIVGLILFNIVFS